LKAGKVSAKRAFAPAAPRAIVASSGELSLQGRERS
jgi:hypothetical protein